MVVKNVKKCKKRKEKTQHVLVYKCFLLWVKTAIKGKYFVEIHQSNSESIRDESVSLHFKFKDVSSVK